MRAIRNGLNGAGIPVENSKGEWGPGQEEINVRYAEALEMADRHAIIKNGCKEIAYGLGKAVTFMAKWDYGMAGSSCHVHQSLWSADGKSPLFFDKAGEHGMSATMKQLPRGPARARPRDHLFPGALHQFLQALHGRHLRADARHLELRQPDGRLSHLRRRHQEHPRSNAGSAARTSIPISPSRRCSRQASTASRRRWRSSPRSRATPTIPRRQLREVPKTLREARALLDGSRFLRGAMGDEVIDHYVHTADWEQFEFDRRVTDLELKRGFERY